MFKKTSYFFKKIFNYFCVSKVKILSSGGLILVKDFMNEIGIVNQFKTIPDNREPLRIWYTMTEQLSGIILRILDGENRLSHHVKGKNSSLHEKTYNVETEPHFTTLRYLIKVNSHLHVFLEKILFQFTLMQLKHEIKKWNLKSITLDIDQTDQELYGKQEAAKKGYSAKGKNKVVCQCAVWVIRELGLLIKLELRAGNKHCANGFYDKIKEVIEALEELNIRITVCCDSGYENKAVFEYLDTKGVKFLFAKRQTKKLKTRGKNAKNQKFVKNGELVFKERKLKSTSKEVSFCFREIFVQNRIVSNEYGQLYLKNFLSNEFTNVFVTNLKQTPKNLYKIYKKHAIIESINEELKNDFGLGKSHSFNLNFNQALTQLIGIAYNIKVLFLKKKTELDLKNKPVNSIPVMRLATFQRNFLHIPAILVNHSGVKILKLPEYGFQILKPMLLSFKYVPL